MWLATLLSLPESQILNLALTVLCLVHLHFLILPLSLIPPTLSNLSISNHLLNFPNIITYEIKSPIHVDSPLSLFSKFTHYHLAKHLHLRPSSTSSGQSLYQTWPNTALINSTNHLWSSLSSLPIHDTLTSATVFDCMRIKPHRLEHFVWSDLCEACGDGGASFERRESHANSSSTSVAFDWEFSSQPESP